MNYKKPELAKPQFICNKSYKTKLIFIYYSYHTSTRDCWNFKATSFQWDSDLDVIRWKKRIWVTRNDSQGSFNDRFRIKCWQIRHFRSFQNINGIFESSKLSLFRRKVKIKKIKFYIKYNFIRQLEEDLIRGDKKLLVQILHFLLTKIGDLKKRYYLSKFLTGIVVSDEFSGDEEILELVSKYRTLQAEFQTIYSMVEERRAVNPVRIIILIFSSKPKNSKKTLKN